MINDGERERATKQRVIKRQREKFWVQALKQGSMNESSLDRWDSSRH